MGVSIKAGHLGIRNLPKIFIGCKELSPLTKYRETHSVWMSFQYLIPPPQHVLLMKSHVRSIPPLGDQTRTDSVHVILDMVSATQAQCFVLQDRVVPGIDCTGINRLWVRAFKIFTHLLQ